MSFRSMFVFVVLLFAGADAQATTILNPPETGSLTASVLTDFSSFVFYDIRGSITGVVGSTLTNIADSTGGTDPNFLTLPFGNMTVFAFNGFDLGEIVFDPGTVSLNGIQLTIDGVGSLFSSNGTLTELVGPLVGTFGFASAQSLGPDILLQYDLTDLSSPVPEPATYGEVGLGLLVIGVGIRRMRRSNPSQA